MFFEDKINKIRSKLDHTTHNKDESPITATKLYQFMPVDCETVRRVISAAPDKSCELDPIPTWLVKKCIAELVPLITSIINASLITGEVPNQLKFAIIKPHLKQPNLNIDELKKL